MKELKLDNFVEEIDADSSLQRSAVGWPCCLSYCVQLLSSGEEKTARVVHWGSHKHLLEVLFSSLSDQLITQAFQIMVF